MNGRRAQVASCAWSCRYFPTEVQISRRCVGELGTMVSIGSVVTQISTDGQLRGFRNLVPYELAQAIRLVLCRSGQDARDIGGRIRARNIDTDASHGNQA